MTQDDCKVQIKSFSRLFSLLSPRTPSLPPSLYPYPLCPPILSLPLTWPSCLGGDVGQVRSLIGCLIGVNRLFTWPSCLGRDVGQVIHRDRTYLGKEREKEERKRKRRERGETEERTRRDRGENEERQRRDSSHSY